MPNSPMLARKGTRQPQRTNSSPGRTVVMTSTARLALAKPSMAPACGKLVKNPRRRGDPDSNGQEVGSAPLPADAEPLEEPAGDEEKGTDRADDVVRRNEPDADRTGAHGQHGDDQRPLPPDSVSEVAEDRRADWAGAEADEVGGEREQHPGVRVLP